MSNIIKDREVGVSESSDSSVSAVSSKLDNYSSGERSVMARFISGGISNRAMVVLMSITGFSAQGCRADLLPPPQLTFAEGFVDIDASDGEKADGAFVVDGMDGGARIDDAMDGSDDDISDVGEEVDAIDGSMVDDATDGSTDDAILEVDEEVVGVDGEDASIDDASLEVGEDVVEIDGQDAVDGGIDDAVDGSTDLDVVDDVVDTGVDGTIYDVGAEVDAVVDSVEVSEPLKTCDGKPVGTVQIIPTQGINGEVGICVNGKEICSPVGVWEIQSAPVDPAIAGEVCSDALDNNCNGVTDEVPCSCDGNVDGLVDMDKFDPLFKTAVIKALGKKESDVITSAEAAAVLELTLSGSSIVDLSGLECFVNIKSLNLSENGIVDISPLSALVKLVEVVLTKNNIIDISVLKDLYKLNFVGLAYNSGLKDVTPLILNPGFSGDGGDMVNLMGNVGVPVSQIVALKNKGVTVMQ